MISKRNEAIAKEREDRYKLIQKASAGDEKARLALDVLVHETRRWASSFLFSLGGLDAFTFTAGIGENNPWLRSAVCEGLEEFGVKIDPERNEACKGVEAEISATDSKVKVYVIPANEELVLAREVFRKLTAN